MAVLGAWLLSMKILEMSAAIRFGIGGLAAVVCFFANRQKMRSLVHLTFQQTMMQVTVCFLAFP
ncbi:hypothetical protein D5I55_07740 [Chakrabartia godavariana]|nr:hypothetical protein D5I55_07740 [Chakrabartia godavariana]